MNPYLQVKILAPLAAAYGVSILESWPEVDMEPPPTIVSLPVKVFDSDSAYHNVFHKATDVYVGGVFVVQIPIEKHLTSVLGWLEWSSPTLSSFSYWKWRDFSSNSVYVQSPNTPHFAAVYLQKRALEITEPFNGWYPTLSPSELTVSLKNGGQRSVFDFGGYEVDVFVGILNGDPVFLVGGKSMVYTRHRASDDEGIVYGIENLPSEILGRWEKIALRNGFYEQPIDFDRLAKRQKEEVEDFIKEKIHPLLDEVRELKKEMDLEEESEQ